MIGGRMRRRVGALRTRRRIARSGLFDRAWYARQTGRGGLSHYLRSGWRKGLRPHPLFDTAWYLKKYPDVAAAGMNPLLHYLVHGGFQGRDPNPYFSSAWYLSAYPDVERSGVNPLVHYLRHGAGEGRRPSPRFDPVFYGCQLDEEDPGRAALLAHFLTEGQDRGLEPAPARLETETERVGAAAIEVVRRFDRLAGEVALLVTHSPDGRLKRHVRDYVDALRGVGVQVVLCVATDAPFLDRDIANAVAGLAIRENKGFDFGAWAHLLRVAVGLWDVRRLYLVNDSVLGPLQASRFAEVIRRVRASPADLVGLTESRERGWHVQSYFLALGPRALANLHVQRFFNAIRNQEDVEAVIDAYEATLAARVAEAGLAVEVLFPSDTVENPTLFAWRELLDRGFPFIKTSVLAGRFAEVDASGWRERLEGLGYDLALADDLLPGADRPLPRAGEAPAGTRQHLQRVAFYGPWNYESGLGEASRGYLSALMRLDLTTNVHGVQLPFHVHRRLGPGYDLRDFAEPADVAVVHLNPDGWHLMTPAQREEMSRARLKVGLWVWEMEEVPDFFYPNLLAVDAIWSPSAYCARVFAKASGRPTHVVPHVVPLPPLRRERELARTILYAFDGSSYLSRKNPVALVQAFKRSGLARRGWTLVLKTKNLAEAGEEGAALEALCAGAPGVALIDARYSRQEMAALFDRADIYASPHASEGFGLTIAEAMAAGKLVVATDYSGSRDLLDGGCGFPVAYDLVEVENGAGHYRKGGVWAAVRVEALAEALAAAAERLEAGDPELGLRARDRIGERCSPAAVAIALCEGLGKLEALQAHGGAREAA